MNKIKFLIPLLIIVAFLFFFKRNIFGLDYLPTASIVCEGKNGDLRAFGDNFSNLDNCKENSRQLAIGSKALKTFDKNGNELGIYMSTNAFFNTVINKEIQIRNNGSGELWRSEVYFKTQDCSGNAYIISSFPPSINTVYSASLGKYYLVDKTIPKESIDVQSVIINSQCTNLSYNYNDAYTLIPISLPFSEPISVPLEIRYQ